MENREQNDQKFDNLIGLKFGELIVLSRPARTDKWVRYLCQCSCGKQKLIIRHALLTGATRSCGHAVGHIHGFSYHPLRKIWEAMIRRCIDPKIPNYHSYGGRGITVCERWLDFENFVADVGMKPSKKHSLDRIDVNGNYEPGNCRWATAIQQQRNRRNNRLVEFEGRTQCIAAWAEEIGIRQATLWRRIKTGEPIETALTRPVFRNGIEPKQI